MCASRRHLGDLNTEEHTKFTPNQSRAYKNKKLGCKPKIIWKAGKQSFATETNVNDFDQYFWNTPIIETNVNEVLTPYFLTSYGNTQK